MDTKTLGRWEAPQLQFKGVVGDILKNGGGKLSISGGDPGEMRCQKPACKPEKPH